MSQLQGGLSTGGTCFAQSGTDHCKVCNNLLEVFDGSHEVAYRLTVHPGNLGERANKKLSHYVV